MASSTPVQSTTTVYRTRPILGPLTTEFTAPPDCEFAAVRGTHPSIGFRAQTCVGDSLADASTCWPPVTSAAPSPTTPLIGWGFYSPGISCPAGHSTACSATYGSVPGWSMQFAMEEGETAVGCCPTGFSCARWGNGQTCAQAATEAILTAHCSADSFVSSESATFPIAYTSVSGESLSTASLSRLQIGAPMIQINWRSEDLATATQSATTASTPDGGFGAGNGNGGGTSSGSFSAGAFAGIIIAGVVAVFAIAAAIYRLVTWRRARRNANAELARGKTSETPQDGNPRGNTEMPATYDRPELSGIRNPSELSGYRDPAELPASSPGPRAVQGQP